MCIYMLTLQKRPPLLSVQKRNKRQQSVNMSVIVFFINFVQYSV